ncbi:MAG: alpha/beta fold hydrolase [Bdellovibrionales bacterium]
MDSLHFHLTVIAIVFAVLALAGLVFYLWRQSRREIRPFDLSLEENEVEGWTWRFHRSGRGPDLVLIHGIGADLFCWRQIIPLLNPDYRVWAVDLPGFGGSTKKPDATYGLDDQVTRLHEFLDEVGVSRAHLVGNSMGGNIALWLAHKFPKQVASVTVIGPATSPKLVPLSLEKWLWLSGPLSWMVTKSSMEWIHRRTVSRSEVVDPSRVDATYRTYRRNPDAIRSFLRATEAIRDSRLPGDLRDIKCPVQVLWGSRDKLVSKKVIDDLKATLPKAPSHVHIGGGHHLQEDEPQWVHQKIVEFSLGNQDETP